jgi:choline-sulfatase
MDPYAGDLVRVTFRASGEAPVTLRSPQISAPLPPQPAPAAPRASSRANVLLYHIDTLRADHLGCYGYTRATSPRIDALAREAVQFSEVMAQASWTRPATASILTGLYPPAHGAMMLRQGIRADIPTLAEVLFAHGYQTAGFVTNVNVAGRWGFQRGFEAYEYLPEDAHSPNVHVRSDELNAHVFAWLRERHREDQPFFLYVHATDPHGPYTPPESFAERFVQGGGCAAAGSRLLLDQIERHPERTEPEQIRLLEACYDAEIASTDANFGALLDELKRLHLYENTVVVLTADHGEEFFDHGGFEHGRTLYQEQLRVPLILRLLDEHVRNQRATVRARQIDIAPTLLDYLGIPIPQPVQGRSLLPMLTTATHNQDIDSFAQTSLGGRRLETVITDSLKVIHVQGRGREHVEAYDLRTDGKERSNMIEQRPILRGYARQALIAWSAEVPKGEHGTAEPPVQPELDQATLERLRALGYTD